MTKPYDTERIGPMLARLRQTLGYSQEALADLLCARSGHVTLTRHEISRWEREARIPSEFWLRWLAEVFGIPTERLRTAVAATRGYVELDGVRLFPSSSEKPESPLVASWLTLQHGPKEIMIALGGVEVDLIRTVLAPLTPPEPASHHGGGRRLPTVEDQK